MPISFLLYSTTDVCSTSLPLVQLSLVLLVIHQAIQLAYGCSASAAPRFATLGTFSFTIPHILPVFVLYHPRRPLRPLSVPHHTLAPVAPPPAAVHSHPPRVQPQPSLLTPPANHSFPAEKTRQKKVRALRAFADRLLGHDEHCSGLHEALLWALEEAEVDFESADFVVELMDQWLEEVAEEGEI
jgi:hypothetical protein